MLLPLFAAAILGGIGSVPGAVVGGSSSASPRAATVGMVGAECRAAVSFVVLIADPAGAARPGFSGSEADGRSLGLAGLRQLLPRRRWHIPSWCWGSTCNGAHAGCSTSASRASSRWAPMPRHSLTSRREPRTTSAASAFPSAWAGWVRCAVGPGRPVVGATLRLRSDYLAITTFGVAIMIQLVGATTREHHGRLLRHQFIPRPFAVLAGHRPASGTSYLALVALVLLASSTWPRAAGRAAPGAACCARSAEDERRRGSLGKNPLAFRLQAFVLGGMLMGLAGAVMRITWATSHPRTSCRS